MMHSSANSYRRTEPGPSKRRKTDRVDVYALALGLLRDLYLNPALEKRVEGLIRRRDWMSLACLSEIQDREYQDPEMYEALALRQIAALFKKNEAFSSDDRCSLAAEENFLLGERICRITNKRIEWYFTRPDRMDPVIRDQVYSMQRDLTRLFGDASVVASSFADAIRLTSGATEDRSRVRSLPFLKITGKLRGPRGLVPHLGNVLKDWGVDLSSLKYEVVDRNEITLVPKNWKTHRTIAKEAVHLLPFQLAIDKHLKKRLRAWGIDLSHQGKNQELARVGSITGNLATIDLSMASDTVALSTVALLIPPEWFDLLMNLRATHYRSPWGDGTYSKISSMGNGFTFSLETAIFGAACRAVGSRQYAVYGDDIIVETDRVSSLVRLLSFLGFKTNVEKTFCNPDSHFRESCGCDYYKGHLVTPFYMTETPRLLDLSGVSHVLNGLVSVGHDHCYKIAIDMISRLHLRVVPYNTDSRSGVWITPNAAWRLGKIRVDRRKTYWRRGVLEFNKLYGYPVFDGYTPVMRKRRNAGWRTLLLWHMMKRYGSRPDALTFSKRWSTRSVDLLREAETSGDVVLTSLVAVGVRYHCCKRQYVPRPLDTPSYLYRFSSLLS